MCLGVEKWITCIIIMHFHVEHLAGSSRFCEEGIINNLQRNGAPKVPAWRARAWVPSSHGRGVSSFDPCYLPDLLVFLPSLQELPQHARAFTAPRARPGLSHRPQGFWAVAHAAPPTCKAAFPGPLVHFVGYFLPSL